MTQPSGLAESWSQLRAWLTKAAPRTAAALDPPLTAAEVAGQLRDVPNSHTVAEWFSLHNGDAGGVPGPMARGWMLMSLEYSIGTFADLIAAVGLSSELGSNAREWWADQLSTVAGAHNGVYREHYFPILQHGDGTFMFIDLGSGSWHGCLREWAREETDQPATWSNVEEMLRETLNDAEAGRGSRIVNGALEWDW